MIYYHLLNLAYPTDETASQQEQAIKVFHKVYLFERVMPKLTVGFSFHNPSAPMPVWLV